MSLQLIETEIRRFLSTNTPEVLCITGDWGVGKTFAWNKYLRIAQQESAIALTRYSYVSLFGVKSLDELKWAIFENSVDSSKIGIEPTLDTLRSNTLAVAERLGRIGLGILQHVPLFNNYVGNLGPSWFLFVKNTIVCIDDIERVGQGLSIREVFGIASSLKELKQCKLVLILNDGALETEGGDFRKYFEKVVDTSLKFAPSAEESVRIAVENTTLGEKLLAEYCVQLGISNIRLIKRIQRSVRMVEPLLTELAPEVLQGAVKSLALFGWAVYEPGKAPSLEFLTDRRKTVYLDEKKPRLTEEEVAWNALLDVYGFTHIDDFDRALLSGVRNGYFESDSVRKLGTAMSDQIKAEQSQSSFIDAWKLYHDSFKDNEQEVLDCLSEGFVENVKNISPMNLSSTVALFKSLGRAEQASEMIDIYLKVRGGERELFDLENSFFGSDVQDPDVREAFKEKHGSYVDERDPIDVLLSIRGGWHAKDLTFVSSLTVDDYYSIFKNCEGDRLHKVLNACFQFATIDNASPEMKAIVENAKQALGRIARESRINAHRVRRYGVEI